MWNLNPLIVWPVALGILGALALLADAVAERFCYGQEEDRED